MKLDKKAELHRVVINYFPTFEAPEGEVNSNAIMGRIDAAVTVDVNDKIRNFSDESTVHYRLIVRNLTSNYSSKVGAFLGKFIL